MTLLQSLSGLENDRAALLGRRTRNDPDVQHLTERINEVDEQLAAITTTYLEGLTQQVAAMDGSLGAYMRQQFDKAGIYAFEKPWDLGFRQITNSKKPINTPPIIYSHGFF